MSSNNRFSEGIKKVKAELRKATEALRNKSMDDLVRILNFMHQLEEQLEEQYREMIANIDNCK